jgi:hypothetical protein
MESDILSSNLTRTYFKRAKKTIFDGLAKSPDLSP